ncbi:MAG: hypothetical protein ACLFTK_05175 [Anaerolineales bacterium]
MSNIEALGPDAEVLGGAINGFVGAVNSENIIPYLEQVGMTHIDPDAWYPKQMYIDLWNIILQDSHSSMMDFVSIGMTIAETAWPAELDGQPFEDILLGWGEQFDVVNRGEDRGYVRPEKLGPNAYALAIRTPDPDDLHYGIVYGVCKRFLPHGVHFKVAYDDATPRRDFGGDETVILITWDEA